MANPHENIDREIVANTLKEIAHKQRGGSMDVLYEALTRGGDKVYMHEGMATNKMMETRMDQKEWLGNMLRLAIEKNPEFGDTLSYEEGMKKLDPQKSILRELLKKFGY
jgi:hypothetical protein